MLETVLAPLVEADEGELYLVQAEGDQVHLHLAGRFAGCPGNTLATRRVIEPLLRRAKPSLMLQITSGAIIPEQARRLTSD
ncbi:MAG: NifU family protein [Polyangiaceae bacterium]|nr:NifU family protein [Polyangiaceae bacterium]MCW5790970.1 NifU family protein [Polyangiaceae bacterium]